MATKRFTVAVVAISGCILGPACQAIVGIGDRVEATSVEEAGADATTPTPTTPTNEAGGPTDADPCAANPSSCIDPDAAPPAGCPAGCLPPAPTGWKGPSATYDGAAGTKPANCPAWYTEKDVEGHQGMTAAPATCSCGNPVITGRKCTYSVLSYTDTKCTFDEAAAAKISSCSLVNGIGSSWKVSGGNFAAGTCTYPSATATPPAPSFAKVDVACSQPQAPLCANRPDCVATPALDAPYGKLCIHKEGEHPCPSQDYAQRFVSYKNIDDQRTCTPCTGTASAGTCGTTYGIRGSEVQCPQFPSPSDKTVDVTCTMGSSAIIDTLNMQPASGSCTTTAGVATGIASSIEPVTFCCNL